MQLNTNELFKEWQWSECLSCLDNIIRYSDNLVLISGANNSGKTTLKQELLKLLESDFKIFSTFGEQQFSVATFIRNITVGFGASWKENTLPTWDELQKFISAQPSVRWVLVIDDADKISWDNLNALIRLYTVINTENSRLSIMLFAHSNLEYSLKQSVLKDFFANKLQTVKLKPLTFDQMLQYLNNIKIKFDSKNLKQIYQASEGYIGKIKQLAISKANLSNVKYNVKDNIMNKDLLIKIINSTTLKAICCSLLVVAAYVLFGVIQKNNLPTTKLELEQIIEMPESQQLIVKNEVTKSLEEQPPVPDHSNLVSEELYQKLYTDLQNNLQQYMQTELNKLEQQVTELKAQLINNANTVPDVAKLNNTEHNLLNTAKNRYTLQIMAAKDEYSVKKLFNNYPQLLSKAKYFRAKFRPEQNSMWFVVVHGSYANRELAVNDIKNLPLDVQTLKPIVRNYNYIHQIINNKSSEK